MRYEDLWEADFCVGDSVVLVGHYEVVGVVMSADYSDPILLRDSVKVKWIGLDEVYEYRASELRPVSLLETIAIVGNDQQE